MIRSFATDIRVLSFGYKKKKEEEALEEAIPPSPGGAGLTAEALLGHGPGLDQNLMETHQLLVLVLALLPGLGRSRQDLRRFQKLLTADVARVEALRDHALPHVHLRQANFVELWYVSVYIEVKP